MKRTVLAALVLLAAAACTPAGAGGTPANPHAPVVSYFAVQGAPFTAPALVTMAWSVSDPNGLDLTCRIDHDGDGTWDLTIAHCQTPGGRNHAEPVGSRTARFEVTNGVDSPVAATASYTVTAGAAEPYNIVLRPSAPLTAPVQAAFDAAVTRWQSIVTRGVPDLPVTLGAGDCLAGAAAFSGTVDDLMIDVAVHPIDGVGGILGQAGPCVASNGDNLTRTGVMEFDSADVAALLADGTFGDVVLHEMGHVLGIGTLWNYNRSLLTGAGTPGPRYVGPRGMAEWSRLGGALTVPVEDTGGAGTADSHWSEATFGNELMTGYLNAGSNPLSALSIASLGDLGYSVDLTTADAYSLPGASMRSAPTHRVDPGIMLRPTVSGQ